MAIGTGQITSSSDTRNTAHIAHGIVISFATIIWFPLGVFLLRLLKLNSTLRIHAAWQGLGLFLLIIGAGLGGWLSDLQGGLWQDGHVILGVVITIAFLLMPIFGWLHHKHFVAVGGKNYKRQIHVWGGRALLILSVINGGTGFSQADNTTGGAIAYGVIAGIFIILYGFIWFVSKRQTRTKADEIEMRGDGMEMRTP